MCVNLVHSSSIEGRRMVLEKNKIYLHGNADGREGNQHTQTTRAAQKRVRLNVPVPASFIMQF